MASALRRLTDAMPSCRRRKGHGSQETEATPDVDVRLKIGAVLEPRGQHKGTIVCLHGLDDEGAYWQPFVAALESAGLDLSGVRCVFLEAPRRTVWGERMAAWFEYLTDRSGAEQEDDINDAHLLEMRTALHQLINDEARQLEEATGGSKAPGVFLLGSSQGGSVACDAALTSNLPVAGVAMLRSLVLGATARAAHELKGQRAGIGRLPVLAVSGEQDDTFTLSLVKNNLAAVKDVADVRHVTIGGLDHMTSYSAEETLATMQFLSGTLNLALDSKADISRLEQALPKDMADASEKSWGELSEHEQMLASRLLGTRSAAAWDKGSAKAWSLSWKQLSHLQRQAAAQLGFTEEAWDQCDKRVDEDPACEKSWDDLTDAERAVSKRLGVNGANAWDNGTAPVWSKSWHKLSDQQRKAAMELGFTEKSWNENS